MQRWLACLLVAILIAPWRQARPWHLDAHLALKNRPREAVLEELRQKVSLLPGTNVIIGQPISHRIDHMLSGTRANIAVKIFGDDLQLLRQLAATVQAELTQVPGVNLPLALIGGVVGVYLEGEHA